MHVREATRHTLLYFSRTDELLLLSCDTLGYHHSIATVERRWQHSVYL